MKLDLGRLLRSGLLTTLLLSMDAGAAGVSFDSGRQKVTLIELFTSQGCSSCPPAESWLTRFKDNPMLWTRVVPLAFHVDYWDSLGWKDPFASADHSRLQYRYKEEGRLSSVYTPGMLVDGKEWRGWVRGGEPLFQKVDAGRLTLALRGRRLTAGYDRPATGPRGDRLSVAVLAFDLNTSVERGENRGRTLAQEFVVVGFSESFSGNGTWTVSLPDVADYPGARYALAAWVSNADRSAVLQATGGWLAAGELR